MTAAKRSQLATFDDFCFHIHDGEKGDLIDGVITIASPENTDANDLFMWLGGLMYDYVEEKGLGKIFGSRIACRLDAWNGPEPDILFVKRENEDRIQRGRIDGAPDLAVEIVSPDSIERDYQKKRLQYEAFGVGEYWIVDEMKQEVTLLRLGLEGKYRRVESSQGKLVSRTMRGFWFKTEWLWPETRITKTQALKRILRKRNPGSNKKGSE